MAQLFKIQLVTMICFVQIGYGQVTQSHFKVRNDAFIQYGHERYKSLSMGGYNVTGAPNGVWSIEHWDGGLNFWRPYPVLNPGNYFLFIDDNTLGVGISRKPGFLLRRPIIYLKLDVEGHARAHGWHTGSDEKLKSNITSIENPLEKVMKLRGVSYDFHKNYNPYENLSKENANLDQTKSEIIQLHTENIQKAQDHKERRIGFIAQEVEKVIPEAVAKDNEGIYSIEYDAMIPLLVEALKEQQKMIKKLELRIQELEKR